MKECKRSGAAYYVVYDNKCGKNSRYKKIKTVKGTSFKRMKLKKGTCYVYAYAQNGAFRKIQIVVK